MMARWRRCGFVLVSWRALAVLAAVAGLPSVAGADKKRANEPCTQDSECKGHCYTRKDDGRKVCVDCDPSFIEEARREVANCKAKLEACSRCQQDEVWQKIYEDRRDLFERCAEGRKKENDRCWDGGDSGHKQAHVSWSEGRTNCADALSDCKSKGLTYTCSPDTYKSRNGDVENSCAADMDRSCDGWSRDVTKVDCRAIETARDKAGRCKSAVDSLKSSCLDRFSQRRERQRDQADKGYYRCNELLSYKKSNNACK